MARIRDVSLHSASSARLIDHSDKGATISADTIAKAFNARAVASTKGLDFLQIRDLMTQRLQSSGGRPSLVNASERVKVPKLAADWRAIDDIAARLQTEMTFKPSSAQVAAVMLHWAVSRMSAEDVKLELAA